MKHSFIDKFSELDSLIHRLDPRTKIVSLFLFIIFVVTTSADNFLAFALYFSAIFIVMLLSKIPLKYFLERLLVIIPFVILVAIFIPFLNKGQDRFLILWNVLIKSFLAILATIILSSTTRFHKLLKGLQLLKFPKIMILILSFMYRYIFVLTDEAMRMERARNSRYFGGEYMRQLKIICNIIGLLFIRSYERGERVYQSMSARGFNGTIITMDKLKATCPDVYFYIIFLGFITIVKVRSIF